MSFFRGVNNRSDDCQVTAQAIGDLSQRLGQVNSQTWSDMEQFSSSQVVRDYHNYGHVQIAACNSVPNQIMAYAEMSARDPIFWRWHHHLDMVFRENSDKVMGRLILYTEFNQIICFLATLKRTLL